MHQTIVPGMNSSWLQIRWVTHFQRRPEKTCRCPLAWLGCPWASTRQAPLSKEVRCHRLSIENMIIQVTPHSNSSASSFLARMIVFLCGKWRKKYRRETKKGEATNKKQKTLKTLVVKNQDRNENSLWIFYPQRLFITSSPFCRFL